MSGRGTRTRISLFPGQIFCRPAPSFGAIAGCLDADFRPGFFRDRKEHGDDLRIELPPRLSLDFVARHGIGASTPVRPVRHHGIEGVGDGEDSGSQGDFFPRQALGIPRAVITLLVGENDLRGRGEKGYPAHQIRTRSARGSA